MTPPYFLSLYRLKSNQKYSVAALIMVSSIWIIFKMLYPYPFITWDSTIYITFSYYKATIGYWPAGYSYFIRLIGFFSHSPTFLVTIQYFILQVSFLFLFLTIRIIFRIKNLLSNILFVFLFLNPVFIIGSNHIMSDILFLSFSIIWITLLMWIIIKPNFIMLSIQAMLLVFLFTLRYAALYYPFITIIAILSSRQKNVNKLLWLTFSLFLVIIYIQFTRIEMEKSTGVKIFSQTSGWKIANNALYMYQNIFTKHSEEIVPTQFYPLHTTVIRYFNSPHKHVDLSHIDSDIYSGCFYMLAPESPLIQYVKKNHPNTINSSNFSIATKFSPLMNSYGIFLIKNFPIDYLKYVEWPNLKAFMYPFSEIYGDHVDINSLWNDRHADIVRFWFEMAPNKISNDYIKFRTLILKPFPFLFLLIHILFLLVIFFSLLQSFPRWSLKYQKIILLNLCLYCIITTFFFTFLTTSVLRFEFVNIILEFITILIILNNKKKERLSRLSRLSRSDKNL